MAVQKAKEDEGKEQPTKTVIKVDKDGNEVVSTRKIGFISTNPVAHYLKLNRLPQLARKAKEAKQLEDYAEMRRRASEEGESTNQEIYDTYFNGGTPLDANEVVKWIDMFEPNEKAFLRERYAYYYDQYEINPGADQALLKRILSIEIALHRIDLKRAAKVNINASEEEKLTKQLRETFESMKWTKKQRSAQDELGANKFTVWMDKMVKDGGFSPIKRQYERDEIDNLLGTFIDAAREMMS